MKRGIGGMGRMDMMGMGMGMGMGMSRMDMMGMAMGGLGGMDLRRGHSKDMMISRERKYERCTRIVS